MREKKKIATLFHKWPIKKKMSSLPTEQSFSIRQTTHHNYKSILYDMRDLFNL